MPAQDRTFQDIKRTVDLASLVRESGVELRRLGQDLVGRCPLHGEDKKPSLHVTPVKGLWHCFGCDKGGDAISWLQQREGLPFAQAKQRLLERFGSASARPGAVPRLPAAPLALDASPTTAAIMEHVAAGWSKALWQKTAAQAYLDSRGLLDRPTLEAFGVGYADGMLLQRIGASRPDAEPFLRQMGILRENGAEHLRGCIVVPLRDEKGRVVQVYGRRLVVRDDIRHLNLPGPRRGIWNGQALSASSDVILCEGIFDAMTFVRWGFRSAVACVGAEAFGEEHLDALKRHGAKHVYIAFDRDDAGDKGARKVAAKLGTAGIGCWRVELPKGMDVNEYATTVQPARKSLAIVIRTARWMGDGPVPPRTSRPLPVEPVEVAAGDAPVPEPAVVADAPEPASVVATPEAAPDPPPVEPAAPAAPLLSLPLPDADVRDGEVFIAMGERTYRARGLERNLSMEQLNVHLTVVAGESFHVDRFNLSSSRSRAVFVRDAASELSVPEEEIKKELGRVMLKLEELQLENIKKASEPKSKVVVLSEERRAAAFSRLRQPDLVKWVLESLDACGVVGERTNKLLCYLAAVSRLLPSPLAILVQSSSSAGKSALMEKVLELLPEEECIKYSAMTGQSLFYMGDRDLRHKILAIAEEEGASRATYALKLLQSEGELSIASTGKDPVTGKLVTQEYLVKGPVMLFLTTTAIDLDEELQNRCLVLAVDERREQTRAIHQLQREMLTVEGLIKQRKREKVIGEHQDVQRVLRKLPVRVSFATRLTFPDHATRTRRDHMKYLTLIQAVALLHQYQRPKKMLKLDGEEQEYIEATVADVELANILANDALGRSLAELPPQTQSFLEQLHVMVQTGYLKRGVSQAEYRFGRREILDATKLSMTAVRRHLSRLIDHEYVFAHRGKNGDGYVYELAYAGEARERERFMMGLIDVASLQEGSAHLKSHLAHLDGDLAHPLPAACTPFAPTLHRGGDGGNGTSPKGLNRSELFSRLKGLLDPPPKPAPLVPQPQEP